MRKSYLGKRGAAAVHYGVADDSLGEMIWLDYSRTEEVGNDVSAQFRTALTYANVETHDLAVDKTGKLWEVVDQEITTPGGASTLRNLRLQEVAEGAQAFGADSGDILLEDECNILLEDDCLLLLESGIRLVAASVAEIGTGDVIDSMPRAASPDRTASYEVTAIVETATIGTTNVYRLAAEAA